MDPLTLWNSFKFVADSALTNVFDAIMGTLWVAGLRLIEVAFRIADAFSVFTLSTRAEPLATVWPLMLWLSGAVALGLFFVQLSSTAVRGGRGFLRLATGPAQYGAALALSVGVLALVLGAADGATRAILSVGLDAENYSDVLTHSGLRDGASDTVKAVLLGLVALLMVIPVGISLILEMIFREAAILLLVCTIPIAAAGLVHGSTAAWYWKCLRWAIAAIVLKPVLALTLVIGLGTFGGSRGVAGLLAGAAILLIAVGTPWVLFRLLAFVDPGTDAGGAFHAALKSETGISAFPTANPMNAMRALTGSGGARAQEKANKHRFDESIQATPETAGGLGSGDDELAPGIGADHDAHPDRPADGPESGQPRPPEDAGSTGPDESDVDTNAGGDTNTDAAHADDVGHAASTSGQGAVDHGEGTAPEPKHPSSSGGPGSPDAGGSSDPAESPAGSGDDEPPGGAAAGAGEAGVIV